MFVRLFLHLWSEKYFIPSVLFVLHHFYFINFSGYNSTCEFIYNTQTLDKVSQTVLGGKLKLEQPWKQCKQFYCSRLLIQQYLLCNKVNYSALSACEKSYLNKINEYLFAFSRLNPRTLASMQYDIKFIYKKRWTSHFLTLTGWHFDTAEKVKCSS